MEEFGTKEERDVRFQELRKKGKMGLAKTSTEKPSGWKTVWQVSYDSSS
jgi:hypothetical protein